MGEWEDREKIRALELEREALAEEVCRLREQIERNGRWGTWVAWEEAEALLAEVLREARGEDPAIDSAAVARQKLAAGQAPAPDLGEAMEQSRERILAIREALRDRDRRLAELRGQKEELLSIVAHDLRTPLVAIGGFAQLLKRSAANDGLTPRQQEYVDRILQAVDAMNRLIDDLLTARRLEQGRLPFEPRPVGLRRFVEDLLPFQQTAAEAKGVTLRVEGEVPDVEITADPDRLGQALGNLLQNAVKFTPSGKTVRLRVVARPETVRFEVDDEGPGIDPEAIPHLFDRYRQGKLARTVGQGYGLGLHICRELVGLHGGQVGAENLPQGGSRFWMEIPRTGGGKPTEDAS
ncbi:sensor histidine kinase [Deferrisoma sp.]